MKILEVIDMLRTAPEANPLWKDATIIPTFMGAHAIPPEFQCRREEYVNLVISMLPEIKERGLAEFVDIFCDKLAFTVKESLKILKEAHKLGFKLKAHVDQTSDIGGRLLLNELPFVSADHMDYTDLDRVSNKDFVAVLLPGVTYHLMEIHSKKFWEIRAQEFIDKGFAIALATDYNPGSCPCFSMQTIMELAARLYRMTPAQIINAVTINAAHAVGRAHEIGSIEVGKKADILICDTGDYRDMINGFGTNKVRKVIKNGKIIK